MSPYTNYDSTGPATGVILSGNTLYGAGWSGGNNGYGNVFCVNTDGTEFTVLHTFSNGDGSAPYCRLAISSNILYGTTSALGPVGPGLTQGTIFKLNTDGTGFTNLHLFKYANGDGLQPWAGVIVSGNTLYGTASVGGIGPTDLGIVFSIATDGTGYTILHSFPPNSGYPDIPQSGTNIDGGFLYSGVIISDDTLYGTTCYGGNGAGTIFSIKTNGSAFTVLHSFTGGDGADSSELTMASNKLYGITPTGGSNNRGGIFTINTDGTGFTNLHSFEYSSSGRGGALAYKLFPFRNGLIGGKDFTGRSNAGTVFSISLDGSNFTNLYTFTGGGIDGSYFGTPLMVRGNTLYASAVGTIFSLSLIGSPPTLKQGSTFFRISGPAPSVITALRPDGSIVWSNAQPGATFKVQTNSSPTGSNWVDYLQLPTTNSIHTNTITSFN